MLPEEPEDCRVRIGANPKLLYWVQRVTKSGIPVPTTDRNKAMTLTQKDAGKLRFRLMTRGYITDVVFPLK